MAMSYVHYAHSRTTVRQDDSEKGCKVLLQCTADATYCTSRSAVRPKFVLYVREHLSWRSEQRLDPINIEESQMTHTWGGNQTRAHGWDQSTNYHTQYRIGFQNFRFQVWPCRLQSTCSPSVSICAYSAADFNMSTTTNSRLWESVMASLSLCT